MKKKLITLIAAIAVTSTFISAPVALASNNQAQTNIQQVGEQIQRQEHMPSEEQVKVTSGESFASPLQKRNAIKSNVASNAQTQTGGADQKEELPVRNRNQEKDQVAERNFVDADKDGECDNLGEGKTPEPKLDGTGSNGKGTKNFVDADKDGECDNLGEGKTPEPKLDGTGSAEKTQQGKGPKGAGKRK